LRPTPTVRAQAAALALLSILIFSVVARSAELPILPGTTTTASATSIVGKVIVIDPGHGGEDPGFLATDTVREKDIVLAIGLQLRRLLEEAGAIVVMTRESDEDLASEEEDRLGARKASDLRRRAEVSNRVGADAFISIHANAINSPRWYGAQTFYDPRKGERDALLAAAVQQVFVEMTDTTRRPLRRQNIYLMEAVEAPAVTVEVGFLSNPRERELLSTGQYQRRVAWAMLKSLLEWFASDTIGVTGSGPN